MLNPAANVLAVGAGGCDSVTATRNDPAFSSTVSPAAANCTPGRTVSVSAAVVPPTGPPATTVTASLPTAARSAAGISAVSVAALPNVVASGTPLKSTTDPATKPVPVTATVVSSAPAPIKLGLSPVKLRAGL